MPMTWKLVTGIVMCRYSYLLPVANVCITGIKTTWAGGYYYE